MEFIIDRTLWLRGEGPTRSRLLRPSDGKMCCVGQMCKQLGLTDNDISDVSSTGSLTRDSVNTTYAERYVKQQEVEKALFNGTDHYWWHAAYEINDNAYIDDTEREKLLKGQAALADHTIVFIN